MSEMGGIVQPQEIMKFLHKLVQDLIKHKHGWPFAAPVDVEGLNIPQYRVIIERPMDLGTIKSNLESGYYGDEYQECLSDINLVWNNCYQFNPPETDVSLMGKALQTVYIKRLENSGYFSDEILAQARNPHPYKYFKPANPQPKVLPQKKANRSGLATTEQKKKAAALQKRAQEIQRQKAGAENKAGLAGFSEQKRRQAKTTAQLDELLIPFEGDRKPMDSTEMEELFENIQALPEAFLEKVAQFIQQVTPMSGVEAVGDDVIEFNLDSLDVRVQRHLQRYVNSCIQVIKEALASPAGMMMMGTANSTTNTTTNTTMMKMGVVKEEEEGEKEKEREREGGEKEKEEKKGEMNEKNEGGNGEGEKKEEKGVMANDELKGEQKIIENRNEKKENEGLSAVFSSLSSSSSSSSSSEPSEQIASSPSSSLHSQSTSVTSQISSTEELTAQPTSEQFSSQNGISSSP
ncbi:putative Bromodomain containing protein [Monocercomonoides exilis]|uniref:putative Bromodomain containing protein n=1 Tax=Monocercomonoides exilis TaxID=2049356 RepID=UPI00355A6395|nr:putative Bromodomain containing protein [Monocercomonoides exilis]|eukprot:MONOS_14146.1-p1 / transcript=MONOS_14146.1 / gene=MONOS_14146 / organism=Monocercomonoides_exilis_PA203 / gene_product=Bromodomain containing protein / transcript_product=Bromodomain containing protein / location=Mono_scaffold00946:2786-4244(+) / protein_length=461 / sequence_SO=supercontig / SO=protein_coding / is_pseudo=false